ncbi:hypothetical protein MK366_10825 [Streptococcus sanguinis]|uniref:hypothetical protein n=1 Tax=Streptococcus sanguinis TaxID=1305 RepID=UPI002283FFE8|nr:hypothetical protein [Streptococcus sanguinis]MCY7018110.1 hypothetical protein [Streptococcus sanguinis]
MADLHVLPAGKEVIGKTRGFVLSTLRNDQQLITVTRTVTLKSTEMFKMESEIWIYGLENSDIFKDREWRKLRD